MLSHLASVLLSYLCSSLLFTMYYPIVTDVIFLPCIHFETFLQVPLHFSFCVFSLIWHDIIHWTGISKLHRQRKVRGIRKLW